MLHEAGRRWAEEAPNRELLDCRHLGTARTNGVGDAAAWRMGVQVVVAAMVAEEPRSKSMGGAQPGPLREPARMRRT